MEEAAVPPDPSVCLLPELSAEEVHKNLLRCHQLGRRVDRKKLGWLYLIIDRNFLPELGGGTILQYVMKYLEYGRQEAQEIIRVAMKLPSLPRCGEAYDRGDISLSKLKALARVAKKGSEEGWLEFERTHSNAAFRAEVLNAEREGRDHPRKNTRGLPNIIEILKVEFTLEEMQIVRKALELIAHEMMGEGDGRQPTLKEVLLHLLKWVLATKNGLGSERLRSIFQILYQQCPSCKVSHVHTDDGPVEVPPEHVQKIEGEATKVVIEPEELLKGEALPPGKFNHEAVPKGVEVKALSRYHNCCAHCGRKIDIHLRLKASGFRLKRIRQAGGSHEWAKRRSPLRKSPQASGPEA